MCRQRLLQDLVKRASSRRLGKRRVVHRVRLLETTALPVEDVAQASGFGTVETLRRAFARRVGASPRAYRERFRSFQPA